jgi:NTE family protein
MHGLILSGGSLKGAFQAGALLRLAETGYTPDFTSGTSIGALHALQLASDRAVGLSFLSACQRLQTFYWQLQGPRDLLRKRSVPALLWAWWRHRWQGLYDMTPLHELVVVAGARGWPTLSHVQDTYQVTAVDLVTGRRWLGTTLEAALASAHEPVLTAALRHGDAAYVDGGVRDIAPLKPAIDAGCTHLTVIACQPAEPAPWPYDGSPVAILSRTLGLLTNEILTNDLAVCAKINARVQRDLIRDRRVVGLRVIRPATDLALDITRFTPAQVRAAWDDGYAAAQ